MEQEVEQVEEYEADFESEEEYLNHLNNKEEEEDEVDGDGEEEEVEVNDCLSIFFNPIVVHCIRLSFHHNHHIIFPSS